MEQEEYEWCEQQAELKIRKQQALATWKSIWRAINREYGSPGHFGWDWPTLRITYPQRAKVLMECKRILSTTLA